MCASMLEIWNRFMIYETIKEHKYLLYKAFTAGTGSFYALYTYELFEYCEDCGFTRNLSAVLLLLALCKLMKLNVCYHIK